MNETRKKVLWGVGWALSVVGAFGGGFFLAAYFLGGLTASHYLTRELAEAIQTQHVLEYLDSGATSKARGNLNVRMDGHIIILGSFLEDATWEPDRERTRNFLRRVAEHRKQHPVLYPETEKSGDLGDGRAFVAEMLKSSINNKK